MKGIKDNENNNIIKSNRTRARLADSVFRRDDADGLFGKESR